MRLILTYVGYKSVVSVVIIGKNLFVDEKRDDILFVPLNLFSLFLDLSHGGIKTFP